MSLNFTVDPDRCTACGRCVVDCPASIIKMDGNGRPGVRAENEADCIFCQHCLAICPEAAVSIRGLSPENSRPFMADALPGFDRMELLVRGRRSVRRYRNENVDHALIDRLLDGAAHAPTGVNRTDLTFTLIEDRAVLARLRQDILKNLAELSDAGRLPSGTEGFAGSILSSWKAGRDLVFRDAPHALIVSALADTPCPQQDVIIALSYFELLAQSAGLGTLWCGYLHYLLESFPDYKRLFDLPQGRIYYPMLFGLPAVQYARTVQRSGAATIHKIAL